MSERSSAHEIKYTERLKTLNPSTALASSCEGTTLGSVRFDSGSTRPISVELGSGSADFGWSRFGPALGRPRPARPSGRSHWLRERGGGAWSPPKGSRAGPFSSTRPVLSCARSAPLPPDPAPPPRPHTPLPSLRRYRPTRSPSARHGPRTRPAAPPGAAAPPAPGGQ